MTTKKVIVAYNQNDRCYAEKIKEWAVEGKLGFNVEVIFLDETTGGKNIASQNSVLLPEYVHSALLVIALMGEENMNHPWRNLEKFLFRYSKPRRVICKIPYTLGTTPSSLEHLRLVAYNPNALEKQIRLLINKDLEKNTSNSKFRRRENTPSDDIINTSAV